jgi:hypothetical protein
MRGLLRCGVGCHRASFRKKTGILTIPANMHQKGQEFVNAARSG